MGPVPTSIKVVSILGIIYAGLGLLASPCSVFMVMHPLVPNPAIDALNRDQVYMGNLLVSVGIGVVLAVILLYGSIASLKLKPAGRLAMIIYSYLFIATTLINAVLTIAWVMPHAKATLEADPAIPAAAATGAEVGGFGGVIFSIVFCAAISGVILYFFNRPIAKDAFKGIFPAAPTHFPVEFPSDNPPTQFP
jgi:hypothetical protein